MLFLALSTERLRPDLTIRGVCVGIDEEELQEAVDGFKTQLTLRALAQIELHSNIVGACGSTQNRQSKAGENRVEPHMGTGLFHSFE